jgi:uncharacterized protein YdiU (UPF0061 family)
LEQDRDEEHRGWRQRLEEADRRIATHPGYKEHLQLEVLRLSIAAVLAPNWKDLVQALEEVSTNEVLAVEMIQNVREPVVRDRFHAILTRRLHNYAASAQSLIDHVRRIMRKRTGPTAEEFNKRKRELLQHAEMAFVQDLRDYMLHRTLPFFAHTFTLQNVNTPEKTFESEVELATAPLLEWRKWTAPARTYLMSQGEAVNLRPVVKKHGQLLIELNTWLHEELTKENSAALKAVNKLIEIRNSILAGESGDAEQAEQGNLWG